MPPDLKQDDLAKKFLALIGPGMAVLDLGAGIGRYARHMADRGMRVVAVDNRIDDPGIDGVTWFKEDIREWIASGKGERLYDAILLKNIIQFFERDYVLKVLLPTMTARLRPGGVLAIQTFPSDPEPAFPKPFKFTSFWTADDLRRPFPELQTLYVREFTEERESLNGSWHRFHLVDLIQKKLDRSVH